MLNMDLRDQKGYALLQRCEACRQVDPAERDFYALPVNAPPRSSRMHNGPA